MDTLYPEPESCSTLGLSFLWLEITAKCNLECIHCYADSGPSRQLLGDMALDDWLTILRDAASLGCRQVQFIGGEPTLHPDLERMISFASANNYEFIEVYTNATHIGDQMLQAFIQHGVNVATSFYSDNPETHDTITKRRGSFERTVANLHRLLHAQVPVRAGIIEMNENSGHGERARQFLEKVGVTDIKIDFQRGLGRAAKPATQNDIMGELCGECWKGSLCVTCSGSVYPCVFSRFAEVGSARDGVGPIVNNDRLASFRRALKDTQRRNVSRNSQQGGDAGCDPNCSPCEPGVFKCVPGCAPKRAEHAQAAACNPSTCSPCAPGEFRCVPGCAPKRAEYAQAGDCLPSECAPCTPKTWNQPKCVPAACAPITHASRAPGTNGSGES